MHAVTLRPKGQLTLPVEIRNALGLTEGDRILIQRRGKEIVLHAASDDIDPTAGALAKYAKNGPSLTPAEMREAAERAIAEENIETMRQIERDHAGT